MPTNKQRRQAAQRRLQRQLERREELARKRRRNLLIGVTALAVLAVVAALFIITGLDHTDKTTASAATPTDSSVCSYTASDASKNPNLTDVGLPSNDVPTTGTQAVTMSTNFGDIGLSLDQANAPCAAGAIVYLAQQGFFNGTNCHRETNAPDLQVLQCGDPSGTGSGGAAFQYPTAATGSEKYPRGTIAMANSGQGFDGSQFFLVYGDSLSSNPNYTVVGTIDDAGLQVIDKIVANGIADGAQDGAPAQPVTIAKMTVVQ